jgi:hypothetical protein
MTRTYRDGIFNAMENTMWQACRIGIAAAVVATLVAGCDAKSGDAAAPDGTAAANKKVVVDVRSDMVAAVSASTAGPPVALKFALQQRPMVGEPVDVEVAVIPVSDLQRLYVRFQASAGLTLVKGGETPEYEKPRTGQPIEHILTVMANNDGIFYITAAVVADAEDSSLTRTFSIPVIAGDGVTVPARKPTAQAVDAPIAR